MCLRTRMPSLKLAFQTKMGQTEGQSRVTLNVPFTVQRGHKNIIQGIILSRGHININEGIILSQRTVLCQKVIHVSSEKNHPNFQHIQ